MFSVPANHYGHVGTLSSFYWTCSQNQDVMTSKSTSVVRNKFIGIDGRQSKMLLTIIETPLKFMISAMTLVYIYYVSSLLC